MTGEANMEWDYGKLRDTITYLEDEAERMDRVYRTSINFSFYKAKSDSYRHAVAFIEYNMKEMEITGGNGDE